MALCSSKYSCLKFPCFFRITLILLHIYSANSISFNTTYFSQNSDMIYQGDATAKDHVIQLTGGSRVHMNRSGSAIYKKPMYLWDNATRKLTDFTTNFSFVIDSSNDYVHSDGLSFFLAPNGSGILSNSTNYNQFFTVAFEYHLDFKDSGMEHVGININSVKSEKYLRSFSSAKNRFNVLVKYTSSTKCLCVTLVDQPDDYSALIGTYNLCSEVDLHEYLPEWVTIGFSSATTELNRTYSIQSWQFNSSLKVSEAETTDKTGSLEDSRRRHALVLGTAIGASATFLLIGVFVLLWLMLRRKRNGVGDDEGGRRNGVMIADNSIDDELARGSSAPRRFSYCELEQATKNFAEEEKLGQGGFGDVYRGVLIDLNMEVAVKRFSKRSKQGRKEYKSEVMIISSLRHRNLVQLIGWCHERGEFLLVYEFMPNGSLDYHLFLRKSMLLWGIRYRIVLGLASALLYLHEGGEQCVVHRDIKCSNVMLDISFNTKLGDFGLARLIDHELGPKTTGIAGTMGYMAPEYINTGKASKESDMFSFGVVTLEIACGKSAIDPEIEMSEMGTLVAWVWELYGRESILDAADERLRGEFDEEQLKRLMIVGLWCAHPDHSLRPSIRQVVRVLNYEADIPNLPMSMPIAVYYVPDSSSSSSEALMTSTSVNLGR